MKSHRNVVVLIPKGKDEKIILCRRAKDKFPFPDVWVCAVGGGIESGETPERAMIREMEEEIGISADVNLVGKIFYDSEERSESLIIFTTSKPLEMKNIKIDEREIQYLREFSIDEVLEMMDENPSEFAPTFVKVFLEFARKSI